MIPTRRLIRGRGPPPPPPPRTARQFDDVPLNVVFGEPVSQNRGPRLDSPCRLFCWLGLPASFCRKSGKTLCFWTSSLQKRWKNRVVCGKYWGAKGKCKDKYIHTDKQTDIQTYITLHYITLHYITLHYITLHYTTLHYITLY